MNEHFIFIYGTLRSGAANRMSEKFPDAKFVARAEVAGKLYDLGAFPGLRLDESDSATVVTGEVYAVDDKLLNDLDEFEAASRYRRKAVEISIENNLKIGWTYEPDAEFYQFEKLIASGDWIEYAAKSAAD